MTERHQLSEFSIRSLGLSSLSASLGCFGISSGGSNGSREIGVFAAHNARREWEEDKMVWYVVAIRLIAALLLGALVGAERQWRQRTAGLRTNWNALVAVGSAMFVMMGGLIGGDGSQGRVAAYVVSRIGFLGGGVILKDGFSIRGLNTAATLWCTAAIGTLAGLGYTTLCFIGTVAVLAANLLLRPLWIFKIPSRMSEHSIYANSSARIIVHRLFLELRIFRFLERPALYIGREKNCYVSDLVEIGPFRISAFARLGGVPSFRGAGGCLRSQAM